MFVTFLVFKRKNPRVERFRHRPAEAMLESLSRLVGGWLLLSGSVSSREHSALICLKKKKKDPLPGQTLDKPLGAGLVTCVTSYS